MEPTPPRLLLFSRGRGHATPDIVVADALRRLRPDVAITFASYATGADTFRMQGRDVIDLGLPEEPAFTRVILAADDLLRRLTPAPSAVIVHEEFAIVPVAKNAARPCCFLSDWLPPPDTLQARCLDAVDRIIFLDDPGYYPVPPEWAAKMRFVGAIHAASRAPSDPSRTRRRLGIAPSTFVALVAYGGSAGHRETATPLSRLLLEAWALVPHDDRLLLWVADEKKDPLPTRSMNTSRLLVLAPHADFIDTLAACDVVVTKSNRVTTMEAEALGIPTISVSYGTNPIDDHRIAGIRNNIALPADTPAPVLAERLLECLVRGRGPARFGAEAAAQKAAAELARWLTVGSKRRDTVRGAAPAPREDRANARSQGMLLTAEVEGPEHA